MRTRNTEQEDYLLRIIRQIAEQIARIREMITASATPSAALHDEVDQSITLLLGEESVLLARLDAETAARLLGSRRRVELWATLLELDAEAYAGADEDTLAADLRSRAVALREAAARIAE